MALPCQGPGLRLDKGMERRGAEGIGAVSIARLNTILYTVESCFVHMSSVQGPSQLCRQPWLR